MTIPQAIKKMFFKKTQAELADIWQKVYVPELTSVVGKIWIDPTILDELYIKEYGEYEGSFADEIKLKFGEEVLKAIRQ